MRPLINSGHELDSTLHETLWESNTTVNHGAYAYQPQPASSPCGWMWIKRSGLASELTQAWMPPTASCLTVNVAEPTWPFLSGQALRQTLPFFPAKLQ